MDKAQALVLLQEAGFESAGPEQRRSHTMVRKIPGRSRFFSSRPRKDLFVYVLLHLDEDSDEVVGAHSQMYVNSKEFQPVYSMHNIRQPWYPPLHSTRYSKWDTVETDLYRLAVWVARKTG